ncbi:MAG: universal stress protein [Geminicoccaceae bacterium]|nr:universal stress protein [Geminicoccaceae bacterium]MCB9968412.1 universal stress protein [Geminicoccaceae bacterium]HRY25962.1 universal stress protein [Geminicoccaceae bacterium]
MFTKILAAVDGSGHAGKAVAIAGSLAGRYDADLVIAHVLTGQDVPDELRRMAEVEHLVEPRPTEPARLGNLSVGSATKVDEGRLAAAVGARVLERAVAAAKREGARRVTPLQLSGDAADALLEAAKEQGADLVVVGSRGFGALGSLVMGSVSSKLAHHLEVPCLTVK